MEKHKILKNNQDNKQSFENANELRSFYRTPKLIELGKMKKVTLGIKGSGLPDINQPETNI